MKILDSSGVLTDEYIFEGYKTDSCYILIAKLYNDSLEFEKIYNQLKEKHGLSSAEVYAIIALIQTHEKTEKYD